MNYIFLPSLLRNLLLPSLLAERPGHSWCHWCKLCNCRFQIISFLIWLRTSQFHILCFRCGHSSKPVWGGEKGFSLHETFGRK